MKERLYTATLGRDGYTEMEFYSSHKAGSKANYEDCSREAKKQYGYEMFIKQIWLS